VSRFIAVFHEWHVESRGFEIIELRHSTGFKQKWRLL
jgi:hypothetical protein